MANNYSLGRGEVHFARFLTGTQTPGGFRYFGNTPEFNATIESETLDHFSSDRGIREKDQSVILEVNRTGSFITDHISVDNLSLFFFGSVSDIAATGATVNAAPINDVELDHSYQLGVTAQNPQGVRALDVHTPGPPAENIIVTGAGGTPEYVEGTDYEIDMDLAFLTILSGGTITAGTDILVSYKTKTSTRKRVISGSSPIEGALRYLSRNPVGDNFDWYMPYVKLSPNGDFALKGDEWQQIPFNLEILKKSTEEAIYIDGRALTS